MDQSQLIQYLQGLGISDYSKMFGGNLGLIKTTSFGDEKTGQGDDYQNYVNSATEKAARASSDFQGFDTNNNPWNLFTNNYDGDIWQTPEYRQLPEYHPEAYSSIKNAWGESDTKFSGIRDIMQVDQGLLANTLKFFGPDGGNTSGRWLSNINDLKYDPEYGLYVSRGTPMGSYVNQSGMLESILTDPIWLTTLSFGLGAALGPTAQAAGTAAPAGEAVAGAAGSSLDPLLSSSFLADGALSASELAGILGSEGWSAAEIAALTQGAASGAAGGSGMWDFMDPSSWGDTSWLEDLGSGITDTFDLSQYGLDPNTFNWQDYVDYANTSGGVTGPINEFGGASTNWGDIWSFATETGNFAPVVEKLQSIYSEYIKPGSQVKSIIDRMTGGNAGAGGLSGFMRSVLGSSGIGGGLGDLLTTGANAILTNSQKQALEGATTTAVDMADPFASQRPQYQAQLKDLMTNPNALKTNAAFQNIFETGLDAVNRTSSAKGQLNSGNRLADLMNYGQKKASEFYFPQAQLLSNLSGVNSGSPASAGQFKLEGTAAAQGLRGKQAGDLLYGLQPQQNNNQTFAQLMSMFG